jgi:hypothetical protein
MMGSPIMTRAELFQDPDGRLLYRHVFYRKGQTRNELAVLDLMYDNMAYSVPYVGPGPAGGQQNVSLIFDDGTRGTLLPTGKVRLDGRTSAYGVAMAKSAEAMGSTLAAEAKERQSLAKAVNSAATATLNQAAIQAALTPPPRVDAATKAVMREQVVARRNAVIGDWNRAICRLLAAATGVHLPESPEIWSNWWIETNEVYVPGYKPLSTAYAFREQTELTPVPVQVGDLSTPQVIHYSCLAAGTPVWTDTGPLAIEKIKVGDRVLAQDAETGELAYKPVLHTTVRKATELVKLVLIDDTVECSPGHRFWIAGKGWMKASDILPGMQFHGAAGTTPLRRTEPAAAALVYNLIVADFHSYFVGDLIYSHDITARKPTGMLVPGLAPVSKQPTDRTQFRISYVPSSL